MIKLAFLLIGGRAFRDDWWEPAVLGGAMIALAFVIGADLSDGLTMITVQLFGLLFLFQGLFGLLSTATREKNAGRLADGVKALIMLAVAFLIIDTPLKSDWLLSWLFALGFAFDGLSRLATVMLVRFRRWGVAALASGLELMLAAMLVLNWPFPQRLNVPLCISLFLVLSGATMIHFARALRRHDSSVSIYSFPMLCGRGWNEETAVVMPDDSPDDDTILNMRILVWTPTGAAAVEPRRPLVDRYFAVFDKEGKVSTGHSAVEMGPDLYISHWPAEEIEPDREEIVETLFAGEENDVAGLFQPSYEQEKICWTAADEEVAFTRFHALRLRAFWEGYRRHSTYNVTNRNCSIAAAGALEAALEGSLDCPRPWLRLLRLLVTPSLWEAAYIRSRAAHLCWTPGMVLDYARALKRLVEPETVPWRERLLAHLRQFGGSLKARDFAR